MAQLFQDDQTQMSVSVFDIFVFFYAPLLVYPLAHNERQTLKINELKIKNHLLWPIIRWRIGGFY